MTVPVLGVPSPWRGVREAVDLYRIAGGGYAMAPEVSKVSEMPPKPWLVGEERSS